MDTGFFKRGKTWQIRRAVPTDLQAFLNRKEVLKSLRTGDEAEAIRRYRVEATEIDQYFELQREAMLASPSEPQDVDAVVSTRLSAAEVRRSVIEDDVRTRGRLFAEAEADPERFWSGKLIDIPDTEYAAMLLGNGDLVPFLGYCIREQNRRNLTETTRAVARGDLSEYLSAAGGDILTARRLLMAKEEALRAIVDEDQAYFEKASTETSKPAQIAEPTKNAVAGAEAGGEKLSDVAAKWFEMKLRVGDWTPNTRDEHEAALNAFVGICGDKPIGNYSKADGRRFKEVLLNVPANAHKKERYINLSLADAAEKAREAKETELLSPVTINKLVRKVSAFFSYCMKTYDECATNPMAGQADRSKQGQSEDRDPFSIDQLKTVFSSPLYTGAKSEARWYDPGEASLQHTAKFWVFLIGLFSGARLGEIVQLHVADIKEEAGIPYFDFSKTAAGEAYPKYLKTAASSRLTPIHAMLIRLGFLEFVESRRKIGEVRLFPDAINEDSKKFSNTMSKLYARLLDSVGISGHKEVFHSTRHNFKDACRSAEIPEEISKALMGHEQPGMSARYGMGGKGFGLANLNKAIQKVTYPGLDLDHIRPFQNP